LFHFGQENSFFVRSPMPQMAEALDMKRFIG
jgi:hypothetical protein